MTQDIIEMARQAGCVEDKHYKGEVIFISNDAIERFVKLVRNDYSNKHAKLWLKRIDDAIQAEREACAKVCGKFADEALVCGDEDAVMCFEQAEDAIRARGEQV